MAKQKVEKEPKITELPSDPVERGRLFKSLKQIVDYKLEQDKFKDFAKSIVDSEKSRNYDAALIKDYITLLYEQAKQDEKARQKSELLLERAAELDIMSGRSE